MDHNEPVGDETPVLPPSKFSGHNVRDSVPPLFCSGVEVVEWCRRERGEGQPEQVWLRLHLGGKLDGASIVLRLKTRAATNLLIAMLQRHRDSVWPLPVGGGPVA